MEIKGNLGTSSGPGRKTLDSIRNHIKRYFQAKKDSVWQCIRSNFDFNKDIPEEKAIDINYRKLRNAADAADGVEEFRFSIPIDLAGWHGLNIVKKIEGDVSEEELEESALDLWHEWTGTENDYLPVTLRLFKDYDIWNEEDYGAWYLVSHYGGGEHPWSGEPGIGGHILLSHIIPGRTTTIDDAINTIKHDVSVFVEGAVMQHELTHFSQDLIAAILHRSNPEHEEPMVGLSPIITKEDYYTEEMEKEHHQRRVEIGPNVVKLVNKYLEDGGDVQQFLNYRLSYIAPEYQRIYIEYFFRLLRQKQERFQKETGYQEPKSNEPLPLPPLDPGNKQVGQEEYEE